MCHSLWTLILGLTQFYALGPFSGYCLVNLNCRKKSESQFRVSGQSSALSILSWNWSHSALWKGKWLHSASMHLDGPVGAQEPSVIFESLAKGWVMEVPHSSWASFPFSYMLDLSPHCTAGAHQTQPHHRECRDNADILVLSIHLPLPPSFTVTPVPCISPPVCWLTTLEALLGSHLRANPALKSKKKDFFSYIFKSWIFFLICISACHMKSGTGTKSGAVQYGARVGMDTTFGKTPKVDFAACFTSWTHGLCQADLHSLF